MQNQAPQGQREKAERLPQRRKLLISEAFRRNIFRAAIQAHTLALLFMCTWADIGYGEATDVRQSRSRRQFLLATAAACLGPTFIAGCQRREAAVLECPHHFR